MSTKQKQSISKRLKSLRSEAGISQAALADAAGIDRKTINRIERGHFSPQVDTFFRICRALGVSPDDFIRGIK